MNDAVLFLLWMLPRSLPFPLGSYALRSILVGGSMIGGSYLWGQSGSSQGLILPGGEDALIERILTFYHEGYEKGESDVEIERTIMPWEKTKSVVLSLPISQLEDSSGLKTMFLDTLAATLPKCEVWACYNGLDEKSIGWFWALLESDARIAPHLDRLNLFQSDVFSIWTRDYAPQFALGKKGQIVVIDPSILDVKEHLKAFLDIKGESDPIQQHFRMTEEIAAFSGTLGSDRLPSLIASQMETRLAWQTDLARPGIFLEGGDFVPLSESLVALSESTLLANAGDADRVRETMRKQYGFESTVFLENLPGKTIKHLDLLVSGAKSGVVVLADAPRFDEGSGVSYHRYLQKEIDERFERNRLKVTRALPHSRIVNIPTPPPVLRTKDEIRDELFWEAINAFSTQNRLGLRIDPADAPLHWKELRMDSRIESRLMVEADVLDLDSAKGREKVIARYLGKSFAALLTSYVDEQIDYRSYVNNLYLNLGEESELLLIPKFQPTSDGEAAILSDMEREVETAYRSIYPSAEFVWIDCSSLAGFLGMIHCYTAVVPDFESL